MKENYHTSLENLACPLLCRMGVRPEAAQIIVAAKPDGSVSGVICPNLFSDGHCTYKPRIVAAAYPHLERDVPGERNEVPAIPCIVLRRVITPDNLDDAIKKDLWP